MRTRKTRAYGGLARVPMSINDLSRAFDAMASSSNIVITPEQVLNVEARTLSWSGFSGIAYGKYVDRLACYDEMS